MQSLYRSRRKTPIVAATADAYDDLAEEVTTPDGGDDLQP